MVKKIKNNYMSIYSTYKNIESPLNYSGGKFKMLNFIQENLPDNINTFVDLFGGGFNVGVNIINANSIIYNDYNIYVKNLIKKLYTTDIDYIFSYIEGSIKKYNLSYGSSGYYDLRKFYNSVEIENREPLDLYLLILFGFQHQIRFNSKHEFNNPVGKSGYNDNIKEKLINFNKSKNNVRFLSKDFREFYNYKFEENDFFYCDPPYLITCASYNDGGKRGFDGWSEKIEVEFLEFLDFLNKKNVYFMLSNVIEHKGKKNEILYKWVNDNNFNMKEKSFKRKEVLITNY